MRSKASRQRKILEELDLVPTLRVVELARVLDVSTETVRRDLDEMTGQGVVNRTYGGVTRSYAGTTAIHHACYAEEHQRIAKATLPLLRGTRVLMMGSGSTMAHLARAIALELSHLTVFTHSIAVATTLSTNTSIRVVLVPGFYEHTEAAAFGAYATEFIGRLHADVALLGAGGLGPDGPSDAQIDMAAVYATMARQCGRAIILADHSTFGKLHPVCYLPWANVETLVTDGYPEPALRDRIQNARVRLLQA
ncbi:MAG TPA: DeoR/GlpR family DNA-binding transcription regulator [Paenirhodobacter sp.]